MLLQMAFFISFYSWVIFHYIHTPLFKKYIFIYLFGCTGSWLQPTGSSILVVKCGIFSCGVWDLVPWSGIEPQPPALGTLNLSHWTSREGPLSHFSLPFPTTDEHLVCKAIWALKILQTTEFYHYKNILSLTIWKICQRDNVGYFIYV